MRALTRLFLVLCLLLGVGYPHVLAASELRVLIDVSGSMRWNDPHNLRLPAVRLLSELVPEEHSVGLWLFAESTEVLEPVFQASPAWRQRVGTRLERIHSRGLFTDIEGALEAVTRDWLDDTPTPGSERHVLLLTDGLVDLPAGPEASAQSRARILEAMVPELVGAAIQVHAIGLSDEIDRPLLETLTQATGGWLEVIKDAERLQRIFLRMLEQATPPSTVPLIDNRFLIDASVSEFTVLVFRPKTHPLRLLAPDGSVFLPTTPTHAVQWRLAGSYDLITVSAPMAGTWAIDTPEDPDNRVLVVTDLELALAPPPSVLDIGHALNLKVWATEHGHPIQMPDFLTLIESRARLTAINAGSDADTTTIAGISMTLALDLSRYAFVGQFETMDLPPGDYHLEVELDGGTFQRAQQRRIKLTQPDLMLHASVRAVSEQQPEPALIVRLQTAPEILETGQGFGYLQWISPNGCSQMIAIDSDQLNATLDPLPLDQPGIHQLQARVGGLSPSGQLIHLSSPMLEVPVSCGQLGRPAPSTSDGPPDTPFRGTIDIRQLLLYWLIFNGFFIFVAGLGGILIQSRPNRRTAP